MFYNITYLTPAVRDGSFSLFKKRSFSFKNNEEKTKRPFLKMIVFKTIVFIESMLFLIFDER